MAMLKVENLCKRYEKFYLDNVSFSLDEGYIMGFIGSNGAGKTTTLKAILNMIQNDGGSVEIFGKAFTENEIHIKQDIAFMLGSSDYYLRSRVKTITNVVKRFYSNWNQQAYENYMKRFKLDPGKKISELSEGMRVKYSITLALSHEAKLIIMDEPTSGLDPVARDNLLELFQELVEDGSRSILFSTHITSDLEKCADYITYINSGKIIASETKDDLIESFRIVTGSEGDLEKVEDYLIAHKKNSFGFTGLIKTDELKNFGYLKSETPSLDDIMIYHAKREENYEEAAV